MKNIFKKKKQVAVITPPTTEEVIASAKEKILGDIDTFSTQKDSALSVFRSTANKLEAVNKGLTNSVADLDKLMKKLQKKMLKHRLQQNQQMLS